MGRLKTIRSARPDGAPTYVILDNLSAHKNARILRWAARNKVGLCFTPTNASWVNQTEAHFGPLRQGTLANSHHPNHTVQTKETGVAPLSALAQPERPPSRRPGRPTRRERARVRSEKGIRWGGRPFKTVA